MSIVLAVVTHPIALMTVDPFVALLLFAVFFQPVMPARHRQGVRATRITARLRDEQARYRRPTGYQSPAWTVQTGATR